MTELEAINAIYTTLIAGWETAPLGLHARDATTYPAVASDPKYVPLALKNETFAPAQLGAMGAWVRATIRWSVAEQTTQGRAPIRKYERRGFVIVDLFAPLNEGTAKLALLAKDVRTVLQGLNIDGLNIFVGESRNGPDDPDWATQSVVFLFAFEETG
jgi:hypothetical protein